MLGLDDKLTDATTFEDLLSAIRESDDLRYALIRALADEHPKDFVSQIIVLVGRDNPNAPRFDVGQSAAGQ